MTSYWQLTFVELGVTQRLLDGVEGAAEQISVQLLEPEISNNIGFNRRGTQALPMGASPLESACV